jgi:RND family efflux transporter MFP subunit
MSGHPALAPGHVGLLAAALLALAPSLQAQGGQPSVVGVDAVKMETVSQTVPVIGRLVARRSGSVAARVDGAIERFEVQVGDRLASGDVIADIDPQVLKARRSQAAAHREEAGARLATARAQLTLAIQERDRLARLKSTQATSRAQYDDAVTNAAIAQARVREAQAALATAGAQLELADIDLDHAQVRAPYAGVVVQRLRELGAYVKTGEPLVRMLAITDMEVEADVPFDRLAGLAPGATVGVALDDGSLHPARVRAVIPDENALTRTRAVRFLPRFNTPDTLLAEGQAVTVQVPVGARREAVTVHKDAINRRGNDASVFVVADGVATVRPVELGEPVGTRVEVLKGLAPGEVVVVRGNERLRPGTKVTAAPSS